MKKSIIIVFTIFAIIGIIGITTYSQINIASTNEKNHATPTSCNKSLWNRVYKPDRLHVINPCVTVTGIIENITAEKDGDSHINLKLDLQYSNLVNDANMRDQHGDLVLEVICQNPVYQADAVQSCENYTNYVFIPLREGTHIRVDGSYVTDLRHGWNEIHPVSRIEVVD